MDEVIFWIVVLEKPLEILLTERRSNQSIFKEINLKYPLEGFILKLRPQYFGHQKWTVDSFEKTLMLGKIKGKRRRGLEDEMVGGHHWLNVHEHEQTPGENEGQGGLICWSPWADKMLEMISNWTTTTLTSDFLTLAVLTDVMWYLMAVFICISPIISDVEAYFCMLHIFGHLYILLGEISIHIFCPFLKSDLLLFWHELFVYFVN